MLISRSFTGANKVKKCNHFTLSIPLLQFLVRFDMLMSHANAFAIFPVKENCILSLFLRRAATTSHRTRVRRNRGCPKRYSPAPKITYANSYQTAYF